MKDLYSLLELAPNATSEVIEAAYKALASSGRHNKTKLDEAFHILSNADRKKKYDEERFSLEKHKTVGSYRILSPLAEGGYGKTYLGEHVLTGKKVCIKHCKRLDPQYQQIMIEEWNTLCDLAHYEICVMRDLVKLADGTIALIMSYVPGPTLEQLVQKHKKLDPEDVAWIGQRILNACRYIHSHGVVHGDIKPQNVIIREENHTVVLIDFGLSLVKPDSSTKSKGHTDYFAPPEQEKGLVLVPESDFYSVGATMIFALSGNMKCVERREVPADIPAPLCEFISRLTRKDVLARPRWENENLCDTIIRVRQLSFGRAESRMKPIGKPDPTL